MVNESAYAAKRNTILDAVQRAVETTGYEQMAIADLLGELQISSGVFAKWASLKKEGRQSGKPEEKRDVNRVKHLEFLAHLPGLLIDNMEESDAARKGSSHKETGGLGQYAQHRRSDHLQDDPNRLVPYCACRLRTLRYQADHIQPQVGCIVNDTRISLYEVDAAQVGHEAR